MKKTYYYSKTPRRGSKYDNTLIITAVIAAFAFSIAVSYIVIFWVMP